MKDESTLVIILDNSSHLYIIHTTFYVCIGLSLLIQKTSLDSFILIDFRLVIFRLFFLKLRSVLMIAKVDFGRMKEKE